MPWCPKCKTEYREGFATCSDCGSKLETERNCQPATASHDMVYLISARDAFELARITSLLRARNISAMSRARGAGNFLKNFMGTTIYGIDIYVREADYSAAKDIVEVSLDEETEPRQEDESNHQPTDMQ